METNNVRLLKLAVTINRDMTARLFRNIETILKLATTDEQLLAVLPVVNSHLLCMAWMIKDTCALQAEIEEASDRP